MVSWSTRPHAGGNRNEASPSARPRARHRFVRNGCGRSPRRRQEPPVRIPRRAPQRRHELGAAAGRGRQPRGPARTDRSEPGSDVRTRREDRDPHLVARRPAHRRRHRPEAGRRRHGPRARGERRPARRDRRNARRHRRRPRCERRRSKQAALSLRRHRHRGAVRRPRCTACDRRQLARAQVDARRRCTRPVVHLRRRHHLPALAGQGADRDRRLPVEGGRPDHDSHPRTSHRNARPGRGHAGESHRRPRAGQPADAELSFHRCGRDLPGRSGRSSRDPCRRAATRAPRRFPLERRPRPAVRSASGSASPGGRSP
jgi:hypothetical protein